MPRDENIYVRSYFRVESGYVWGEGMPQEKVWALNGANLSCFSTIIVSVLNLFHFVPRCGH